jgi:2-keto-3-deoxy-L-rhamnonate aldolase RhmA
MHQWIAKQGLDIGVCGIIFPHVSTVAEARLTAGVRLLH